MNFFLVAIGGAIGSVARFALSEFVIRATKEVNVALVRFPFGTLTVNVLGSVLAGVLYYFMIKNFNNFDPRIKIFLLNGFLGGFTTFSTFSLDFFRLFNAGSYLHAAIYMLSSVILAISGLFFGFYLMKISF